MRLLATAVGLALAAPAAAEAAPKPARCHFVEDPAGDVTLAGGRAPSPVARDHVDLRYADVALSRTHLTVTFGLVGKPDADSSFWVLRFASGKETVWVQAGHPHVSERWYGGGNSRSYVAGKGVVDNVRNEIRVAVPVRAFGSALPRKGVVISDVHVTAAEAVGDPAVPLILTGIEPFKDFATSRRSSYVWGRTPLC